MVYNDGMDDRTIRIITTGGTFDKQYDAVRGELIFRESQLPRILNQARVTLPVHLDSLLAVDSLAMTEDERHRIVLNALASVERMVVIVHGTDTMVKTAAMLESMKDGDDGHVFVFTGAMIPYSLENSDFLRADDISDGFGHFASFSVDDKSVRQDALERRSVACGD